LKIAFVIPDLTQGGAEKVFATLLRLWDTSQDEVFLVVLRRQGIYFDLLPPGLRILDLGVKRLSRGVVPLIRALRTEAPDVVFSTQAHVNALLGLLRGFLPGVLFVGRETSIPSLARRQKKLAAWKEALYRWSYRRLDAVVCPSKVVAAELAQDYRLRADQLPVIPNPLDLEAIEAGAQAVLPESFFKKGQGQVLLVAAGRLEKVKGFDLLIQSLALLPKEYRLVILGEGRERPFLQELINKLGLEASVALPGVTSNPFPVLASAEVFVLSSRYEGFPNVVLEALALGVPTAAFRCPGGVSEILEDGVTGVFAEQASPESLAQAVLSVRSAGFLPENLRQVARARYEGRVIVQRLRSFFEELCKGKKV
jgi:glycosyltransferase involved in cell wall biosynthesis